MLFLSQLLGKQVLSSNQPFAKVLDITVSENKQAPPVDNFLVKKSGKKYFLPAEDVKFDNGRLELTKSEVELKSPDEKAFYLAEDLMDKQVIDVTGRRLVRVNDVTLESNGQLKVTGIDIGLAGITRRLGLSFPQKTITLPWQLIEAFDYQTGNVTIKLTQNKLNTFHPAEVADILEEVGTKERMGILETLNPSQLAQALEEADDETQEAILEQLPANTLKNVVNKMPVDELADVINELNEEKKNEIFHLIGSEKTSKVKSLGLFPDDVAGGLMDVAFYKDYGNKTIAEALGKLSRETEKPEIIVVVNDDQTFVGTVATKDLINTDPTKPLKDVVEAKQSVNEETGFTAILRTFAEYNLRLLPVVNENNHVIGVIPIDNVISNIQEQEEEQDEIH